MNNKSAFEYYQEIADHPDVHEALQGFSEDPTGDNGTNVVRAIYDAIVAPVTSSQVRNAVLKEVEHAFLEYEKEEHQDEIFIVTAVDIVRSLISQPSAVPEDVNDAMVDAAMEAFNRYPCPMNGSITRSMNVDQMIEAIRAALSAQKGEEGK